jgi:RHS repeat-associated protein
MAAVVTYYHNDISGSPIAATDAAGNLKWKESYKPYGDKLTRSAASSDNKIGFHGKQHDGSTGLSYMGARYYDPVLGRFMGIDPVDFQEDNLHSFNRYAYTNNNPYKYVDPDGRYALLIARTFAAISAAAATLVTTLGGGGGSSLDGSGGFGDATSYPGSNIDATSSWSIGKVHNTNSGDKPNLLDDKGETHVLDGDRTGGGHRPGTGKPGKSEFPSSWSDGKIKGEISDVATDPNSTRTLGRGGRTVVQGTRDGIDITVVVEPASKGGRIVTGFPTNVPRNPK